jgi:tripartite-type tricarboxylate transporter receptor subunit TctC
MRFVDLTARYLAACALTSVAVALVSPASAQQFPSKPMRLISTTTAGGVNDTICRAFAQQISQNVGQPMVVENRPGAGSMIGMQALAKSPPDGYTVALTTPEPLVYNPLLFTKLLYDPDNDFVPVTQVTQSQDLIIASAVVPGNNFKEIMAYAKANPGKLNFATWGPASSPALYLEWINRANGVNITGIAYKGAPPSIAAILSDEVQLTYIALGFVNSQIKAGKLKAIAFGGSRHSPILPNVPTLSEFNSDPDLPPFFGIYAPAGTPPAIVERLAAEFKKALSAPKLNDSLVQLTQTPIGSTPAEFAETNRRAKASAVRVFKALGIKPTDAPQF